MAHSVLELVPTRGVRHKLKQPPKGGMHGIEEEPFLCIVINRRIVLFVQQRNKVCLCSPTTEGTTVVQQ